MNCYCDAPVKCTTLKNGTQGYVCGVGKCRFFALAPVQAEGSRRIVPSLQGNQNGVVVVRFEVVLHPEMKTPHVTATTNSTCESTRAVLEDKQFQPMWHVVKEAYMYPMDAYSRLVAALKQMQSPRVQIEEVPPFFFRCLAAAQEILAQHEKNVDANLSQHADVDDVVYSKLRPFQKEGVDFIIARSGRGMIADDMGLGKTVQALALAHHYRDEWPVLIVCPLSLVENWAKECIHFCSIPVGRIAVLQTTRVHVLDVHTVVIVPYSSLKCLETISIVFKVVILDESHYIKSIDSKRTMAALKICRAARRVLLLSGTPTLSRPIELYPQLQAIMHPSWTPTKTQFGARYCNAFVSRFGVDYTGHSNMSELHVLLQNFVIRRTKRELGAELPSKSRQLLYIYITPKEKKALEKGVLALRNSFKNDATLSSSSSAVSGFGNNNNNSGGYNSTSSTINATANSSSFRGLNAFDLKIATARAKIAAVQDYVKSTAEQMVESGQKVIIFAHHQCMMEAIRQAVESVQPKQPLDYIYITGETPAAQREVLTSHFRTAPNCHVAVLSMHSSGVGHNLTCASIVVFAELDWNPSTHQQCEDRVHRIGQSSSCVIKYLLAEGTSDSVIWPMLQSKLTVTHAVMEDIKKGGEEWCADVDTRRILRSDVSLAQSSQDKKQLTLEGFLTGSRSLSRPTTQNSENNEEVKKSPQACDQPERLQDSQRETGVGGVADSVLIDVETLRQRRVACKPHTAAAVFSPKRADLPNTPAATTLNFTSLKAAARPQSAVSAVKSGNALRNSNSFGVAIPAASSEQITTQTKIGTPSPLGRTAAQSSPPFSTVTKTLFVPRPSLTTTSSPVSPSVAPGGTATTAVTVALPVSGATVTMASAGESTNLLPTPRSEEIRRYNARRTLFTPDSMPNKRLRHDNF